MKILVTGGNGFFGSWLARKLASEGHHLRLLHRARSDLSSLAGLSFESALGDVTDLKSIRAACQGIEAVFHAAGVISYAPHDFSRMHAVNVGGTENVAKACIEAKVKRLVHTSSVAAVGGTFKPTLLSEDSPYEMKKFGFGYFDTKHEAEEVVRSFVKTGKLDAVIVNPSVMFGAGDGVKSSRKTHLKVAAGKMPFYPPGGCNVMSVEDAVEGHLLALEKGRTGERYILGAENVTIKALFELLAKFGGHRPPSIRLPTFSLRALSRFMKFAQRRNIDFKIPSDSIYIGTMFHWYDITKAQKELGFKPSSAADAIKKSVNWCVEKKML